MSNLDRSTDTMGNMNRGEDTGDDKLSGSVLPFVLLLLLVCFRLLLVVWEQAGKGDLNECKNKYPINFNFLLLVVHFIHALV